MILTYCMCVHVLCNNRIFRLKRGFIWMVLLYWWFCYYARFHDISAKQWPVINRPFVLHATLQNNHAMYMHWNTKPLFVLLLFIILFVCLFVFNFYFVLIFELFDLLLILFIHFIYLFIYLFFIFWLHNFHGTQYIFPSVQLTKILYPRLCYMSPCLVHLSRRLKCTIVITRCPSSVRRRCNIFDFSSETAERNSTKLDRKQDLIVLYQACFFGWSEKQDGCPGRSIKKLAHCTQLIPVNMSIYTIYK